MKDIKDLLKGVQSEKVQRAAILAVITATYEKYDGDDFKEKFGAKLLEIISECPVGDYIDGRTIIAIMESLPSLKSTLDSGTLKNYNKMKGTIEKTSAEIEIEIATEGQFDPSQHGEA